MSKSTLEASHNIIMTILDDVLATYSFTGGGGITQINQESTFSYTVHLSQEGHVDLLTYTVSVSDDGIINIVGKTAATKSF